MTEHVIANTNSDLMLALVMDDTDQPKQDGEFQKTVLIEPIIAFVIATHPPSSTPGSIDDYTPSGIVQVISASCLDGIGPDDDQFHLYNVASGKVTNCIGDQDDDIAKLIRDGHTL